MALKSTNQSYLFNTLNSGDAINKLIKEILTTGADVQPSQIQEQLMTIEKRFKYPLKRAVMEDYKKGKIRLKYSPDKKLPTAMPFFLIQSPQGVVAVISLSTYSYELQNKDMSIDPKKLYTLMEAAHIAIDYTEHHARYNTNSRVIENGGRIYASMMFNAINKKFNIGIDKRKSEYVLFFGAKFFMLNVLGKELNSLEIINNTAKKLCKTTPVNMVMDIDENMPLESYKDINVFLDTLGKVCGINNLNTRSFLETYMQMYGEGTLLGLELFPYFMMNICSASNAAFLNNQYMFETIIEGDGAKLLGAFL